LQAAVNITTPDLTSGSTSAIAAAPSARLFSAMLPGGIIYWRAGSFTPATTWNDLATQTSQAAASATGLILDLRSNTAPSDFAGALRVAGFLGKDQTGTIFQQAAYQPQAGPMPAVPMLIVLTNRETRGAAELLAATLQSHGALVMGEATVGRHPVTPDVTTTANAKDEAVSLALIDRQQVAAVITETAVRHRMSEAALVTGQDPEQDAFIASHEQAAPAATPTTRDIALVEALDSFKAIRVVEGQESSPQTRIADSSSTGDKTVIASTGLGR
jgi:hypothetical protein